MRGIRNRSPKKQCGFLLQAWGPHEGCREFMDRPYTFQCPKPSTHVVKLTQPEFRDFWELNGSEHVRECEQHAQMTADAERNDYFFGRVQIYRYRYVR